MQKTIILLLVYAGVTAAFNKNADAYAGITSPGYSVEVLSTDEADKPAPKRKVCLFWGLIGSCGFQAEASFNVESGSVSDVPEVQSGVAQTEAPNSRSILWGAVQWSVRSADSGENEARKSADN
ncbi:hypothetical protein CYPRO_0181 [Cyclonatronum proteinivorum]|uniref:Uncharacterized protein n=1 Tax=Cyclonatronum proteinivorum TaxID=1457365 RepID=A0A345UG67_9BACT|nr:hypothetical protein [Cyclonatronum proteinivorum]AXI99468.1 hypothetical protein CYPRO_0181 [Cyclonatronum proteinivorum]